VFFTRPSGELVDVEADDPGSHFSRVPNELKLTIADNLGVSDINALLRTSRELNWLLTPYIYRRARNLRRSSGRPYFLREVDAGNYTTVRHFTEVGASVNMTDTIHSFWPTAIHSCVDCGNIAIVQLLIQHGVNVSPANRWGMTPLHYAVSRRHPSEEMVRLLLDAGADLSARARFYDTILHTAAMFGTTSIVELLIKRGAIPTICEADGSTLLHSAARHGAPRTVRIILEAGLNIEATNNSGETPLHIAAQSGQDDNVEVLLQWWANVEATDHLGFTPLLQAVTLRGRWGRPDVAAHRILHSAPRVDGRCWKGTEACVPSCQFANYNQPIVDQLLEAGANILAANIYNTSPLDWAIAFTQPE
jgi:ankyrin repeat protein